MDAAAQKRLGQLLAMGVPLPVALPLAMDPEGSAAAAQRTVDLGNLAIDTAEQAVLKPKKTKRKASAYAKKYGKAFKKVAKKYKKKNGGWKAGGFKAAQKAAHKMAKRMK
jgi:soluble cytochrome b562